MTALEGLGVPPTSTGWLATRHTDADCDHVHVVVARRDFVGQPFDLRNSRRETDRLHQHLARMVGLEIPIYHDPAIPTLRPVSSKRRLNTEGKRSREADLTAVFRRNQPETIRKPARQMEPQPRRFTALHGGRFWNNGAFIHSLAQLGPAWSRDQLVGRLAFCAALRAARPMLAWRVLLFNLKSSRTPRKEILDAYGNDPVAPEAPRQLEILRRQMMAVESKLDRLMPLRDLLEQPDGEEMDLGRRLLAALIETSAEMPASRDSRERDRQQLSDIMAQLDRMDREAAARTPLLVKVNRNSATPVE